MASEAIRHNRYIDEGGRATIAEQRVILDALKLVFPLSHDFSRFLSIATSVVCLPRVPEAAY